MKFKKVMVVVAAHNEADRIVQVVKDVHKQKVTCIVVDDGSSDKTTEKATAAGATVLRHIVNLGKGAAMKTGAAYAVREGADALIFLDGDGQHEPQDIPRFLQALERVDIVFGARKRTKNMPAVLRFGNWFITEIIYQLYGLHIQDSQCGFRAVRANTYPKIVWRSQDYSVESEMIAWAGKAKLRYKELKIKTIYYDKFKGTSPLNGFPIVWNLFMWRFHKRKGKK